MDEQLKNLGNNIIEFWKKLSKKIKIVIISSTSVLVLAAIILTIMLNRTEYVVLFSELEQEETTEVMTKLQEKNIEYKYEKDGQILVPEKEEALLRMQLAQEGYPRSGLNYDVFSNNIDFMTTDYEKKQYMIFQMQERIQSSIKTISGVKDAIVTINIPDDDNFAWDSNKEESSASIKINLLPGYELTKSQVVGIQKLVEKSVLGLNQENIAIIDTEGNDLAAKTDMFQTDTLKLKLEIERQIQKDIENNVKKLLEKAYGKDNIEVSSKCIINLDKKISENLQYIPSGDTNTGVVSNSEKNVEAVGEGEITGGVAGTESNSEIPIYPDVTIQGDDVYYKDNSSINYLVSQLKEQIQHEPGNIEDLSVAVVINEANISDEKKDELKNLIAHSAGIDESKVALHNMEFKESTVEVFDEDGAFKDLTDKEKMILGITLGAIILILIIVVIIIAKIRKAKRLKKEQELIDAAKAEQPEDTWADIKDEIEVKETKEIVLKKQISEFAASNPEIAAQLIRTWLRGDDE